ncbi:extensin-like domain-containing protein [Salinarimonas soli]|uniref:extensin-like domain-containing protein n=1 Tax=Salinarimonas soli TaxID=1638099 RepID=UPI001F0AA57F|nr:extensin family protein [Salinarimonas soli]
MLRRGVAFSVLVVVGFGLTGCGLFKGEQREAWRTQAEEACLAARQVTNSAYMSRTSPIDGPGTCGITYPFRVAAFAGGTVGLSRQATLGCPIIPKVDTWLDDTVQPAAALYFGQPVVEMKSGSYNCRPRNNQRGARLSEHAFGNAVDISAFVFADGREITVVKGWRGQPEEQEFLREVFVGACRHFTTVLGPGADMFHYDHFHLDLARHDARGTRRICKPVLKFSPRLTEPTAAAVMSHGRFQPPADWSRPAPRPQPKPGWVQQPAAEPEFSEEEPDAETLGPVSQGPGPSPARAMASSAEPRFTPMPGRSPGPAPMGAPMPLGGGTREASGSPQLGTGVPLY